MGLRVLIFFGSFLSLVSCGDGEESFIPDPEGIGSGTATSAVLIVNPVINKGSVPTVVPGTLREGVSVESGRGHYAVTDATGLAVIKGLPTGNVPLKFLSGAINLNIVRENELYDVVVSYTSAEVLEVIPAIRYPVGGVVTRVKPGDDLSNIVKQKGAIVFMGPGVYKEDLVISAPGLLLLGSWSPQDGPLSVIEGSLKINARNVKMRGVSISGQTIVNGNSFTASFCEFKDAEISGNSVLLLHNVFSGGNVSLPVSTATLIDNKNLP